MSFDKFYFRKLRLSSFSTLFSIEHRHLEDVFLGAPSQDRARQTDCLTFGQKNTELCVVSCIRQGVFY